MSNEDKTDEVRRVLNKLKATDIVSNGEGSYSFRIDGELMSLNMEDDPFVEIILKNDIEECSDIDVAQKLASYLTSRLAGGRFVVQDGSLYTC